MIRPVTAQLPDAPALSVAECPGLLERLVLVPDPRDRRGLQHPLVSVLALASVAVLAGARSLAYGSGGRVTPRSTYGWSAVKAENCSNASASA